MAMIKLPVPEIFIEDVFASVRNEISYWQKGMSEYVCHLFVIQINEENTLAEVWEKVSARIALEFQVELSHDIEMYNIYLVFLVRLGISKEVKYKIEQDKYCCRKLVEDELGEADFTDEYISNLIGEKIFTMNTIDIGTDNLTAIIDKSVEKI